MTNELSMPKPEAYRNKLTCTYMCESDRGLEDWEEHAYMIYLTLTPPTNKTRLLFSLWYFYQGKYNSYGLLVCGALR